MIETDCLRIGCVRVRKDMTILEQGRKCCVLRGIFSFEARIASLGTLGRVYLFLQDV